MLERDFDIAAAAAQILAELRRRRPAAAVLMRCLLQAEFGDSPATARPQRHIADPFMDDGGRLLEAGRLGFAVSGYATHPLAWWSARQALTVPPPGVDWRGFGWTLFSRLEREIGHWYRTRCRVCDNPAAPVHAFFQAAIRQCRHCGTELPLQPSYRLRQDAAVLRICTHCGHPNPAAAGSCAGCDRPLRRPIAPASCPHCGADNPYPPPDGGPPAYRLFAIQYHCPTCGPPCRLLIKAPEPADFDKLQQAEQRRRELQPRCVPDEPLPCTPATDGWRSAGFRTYRDLHTTRQWVGLELGARLIADCPDPALREALSGRFLLLACRHNLIGDLTGEPLRSPTGGTFTVPPVVIEANLPGSADRRIPSPRGSWAWLLRHAAGTHRRRLGTPLAAPALYCMDPLAGDWPAAGLDAVVTELSALDTGDSPAAAFCSTWLGRLHGSEAAVASPAYRSCRDPEATAGALSALFQRLATALKPGAPLLFGFQQDEAAAYPPLAVALLDAGLTCSASFPYPLAVNVRTAMVPTLGTAFACRSTGRLPRAWVTDTPAGIAALVQADRARLRQGGLFITRRDERRLACAHLLRLAVWYLRRLWDRDLPVHQRLAAVRHTLELLGGVDAVLAGLDELTGVMDHAADYAPDDELVNF